ncbi:hypothetical protein VP277E431_P0246 [Vibrio phage 277E43-1]|nr:hypothetical protein VP277E431_P0246 [Vibrio phage 277E43-1]CAH9014793.1 hypothetical protein VP495E541_P0254 [Vibrio phage 495E54-1]
MAINLRNMSDEGMDNLMTVVRAVDDYPESVIVRLLELMNVDEAVELLNGQKRDEKGTRKVTHKVEISN